MRLGQDFDRAIREDVRSVSLRPEQLAGLPEDYRAKHKPGPDGKVVHHHRLPGPPPLPDLRARRRGAAAAYVENTSRAYPGNEKVLREILEVRAEQARLLGMASWADYVTEDKMSKSGKTVAEFLARVAAVSEGPAKRDVERLLRRKQKDVPGATRVEDWEKAYYEERVKREELDFDSQSVRPYFEFNRVRDGLLDHHRAALRHPLRPGEGPRGVAPEGRRRTTCSAATSGSGASTSTCIRARTSTSTRRSSRSSPA